MRYIKLPGVVLVILFTLLLIIGCTNGLTEADQRDNAGREPQQEGRFEDAIAEYDEAIRLDPQDAGAYINRGNA